MSQKVLLRRSDLTGTVYVVTRWRRDGAHIVATIKHDVTDDFNALTQQAQNRIAELETENRELVETLSRFLGAYHRTDEWLGDGFNDAAYRATELIDRLKPQAESVPQDTTIAVGVPCKGLRVHDIMEIDDSLGSQAGTCEECGQVILVDPIWSDQWAPIPHTVTQQLPRLMEALR